MDIHIISLYISLRLLKVKKIPHKIVCSYQENLKTFH